ncbi:cache domain-containing sensor histidine kinase [Paenibacillus sacheonensis]|uniref:histidine kinase n=1 Tax=Paenibacillus sacheonensis TaxID=742054 RepID=A0A7X4YTV4_9BACL|nr:sensor histidine kinase [Paenibacillus sacheonensis]MBM7568678.1 two-component system sensor histidine kinase YesM [Paenibacillus sacheonensis]NBC72430.1 HAMP domain-containing protein [Paenibacillus sacheonensis]
MPRERPLRLPLFPLKSIRLSISFAFSCVILAAIVSISLISYGLSVGAVEKNSQGYIEEIIKQVNTNIQSYVDNMENISLLAMTSKDVKYYISDNSFISAEERRPYEKRISDLFQAILYTRQDIANIMVFGYNGRFVSDRRITDLNPNAALTEQAWYKDAKAAGGRSVISAPHVQNIIQNEYRWVVSLSRELKSTDGITAEGVFLVDLNLSVINDLASDINLGRRGYVFIVDRKGNIVYHPQQQLINSNLRTELIPEVTAAKSGSSFIADDNDGKRIYSIQDTNFGWKIVGVAYTDDLIASKGALRNSILLYALCGLAISLLISFWLSHRLSRPIRDLQADMKLVERGNFGIQTEIRQMNEIGQLGRSFNMMVGRIKTLMDEIILNQESKRKSELQLLQAQINPHFLYNTLDSIVWMAEQKQHEEVVLMTSALAKLFRASITKDQEIVPIRVEAEHITNYLLIQKMRYDSQLDYDIDIADEILSRKTLKLLLQPFVENAIYHGIRGSADKGLITIRGMRQGDNIVFEVEDNGQGMAPEQVQRLLLPDDGDSRKGIGIRNVNERIKLYFGHEYGVQIRSELEAGTCVTITIPTL